MPEQKRSVCFVAPNGYAALAGRADLKQIGGAEVQQALIAKELARRGHRVCMVTFDHGQPEGIEHDGVRIVKMCRRESGLPILRFAYPRWSSLWTAMTRANTEVYYQRTAGVETGQVALWCRRRRRSMFAAIANDRDCTADLMGKIKGRERWLYLYGLRRADLVIAQSYRQRDMLAANFNIDAHVVANCARDPGKPATEGRLAERLASPRALWVGRFSAQKRLDRLLELALLAPEWHFDVVGGSRNGLADIDDVCGRLSRLSNVTLHGIVPHANLGPLYDRAAALVCTSDYEGFPNTFLEAWSRGVPTLSTVDPDHVIVQYGLGGVADEPAALRDLLGELARSHEKWLAVGQAARRHFLECHTIEGAGDALSRLLAEPESKSAAVIDRRPCHNTS